MAGIDFEKVLNKEQLAAATASLPPALPARLNSMFDWWTRPCGCREVLQVSLPFVVSTISTTVMIFIDRMFLLWYAPKAMAAAMPAGMLHFTIVSFPLGVALYVNTFDPTTASRSVLF